MASCSGARRWRSAVADGSSVMVTPLRSARRRTASTKSTCSISRTKVMASPDCWHPKQWNTPISALTLNDGVFSWWNGHSPTQRVPCFLSAACSLMSATMSVADRTRTTSSSGMATPGRYRAGVSAGTGGATGSATWPWVECSPVGGGGLAAGDLAGRSPLLGHRGARRGGGGFPAGGFAAGDLADRSRASWPPGRACEAAAVLRPAVLRLAVLRTGAALAWPPAAARRRPCVAGARVEALRAGARVEALRAGARRRFVGQRHLGGRQPGDGDPEGRAAHVVAARVGEDGDGLGIAPVLPAHADLERGPCRPAPAHAEPHELPHAVGVDDLEGIVLEEALLQVGRHHPALDVVAAEAEGHLREVVGPEGEEVGHLGDLAGAQRGARCLDHRADDDLELAPNRAIRPPPAWR